MPLNQRAYCKRCLWGAERVYHQFGGTRQRIYKKSRLHRIVDDLSSAGRAFKGVWLSPREFCVQEL